MNDRSNKILEYINKYHSLTDIGKAFEGMYYLKSIENLLNNDDNLIKGDNCISFRELISNLLFIE